MDKYTEFSDHGIDIKNKNSGQHHTTCPQCSESRKKKNDPCLSVNITDGVWNCHHCGWKGSLQKEPLPTWTNTTTLSNDVVEWFNKRNIPQNALCDMQIAEAVEWMPQTQNKEPVICLNYFRDGKLINTKYRTLTDKHFKLTKGAPLLLYNVDGIKNQETIHIVEGEIDALTLIGLGITNVVSVPNGGTTKSNNLSYIDLKDFETATTIAICTDDDDAGNRLAEDLANKLGRERCARVKFGGYKDFNELYCKEGNISKATKELFATADGLPSREQLRMTLKYEKRNKYPALTLRESTLINFGEIFAIAGLPGMGKTTIIDCIICAYLSGQQYFQFKFNRGNGKKVLIMDTERPPDDVSNSHHNIVKRLSNPNLDDQGEIDGLVHLVVSEFGKVQELKSILERELSSDEFDLVVLDGILDFSQSMNDDKDATEVVKWVRALAVKHNCAVVVTIHPNKGTDTIAGHLGSFLYRFCRAILFVRSVQGEKSIRELTGEPDMAKLSHADKNELEPIYFKWDGDAYLMMECDYTPKETRGKEEKITGIMTTILSEGKRLRYSDLVSALINNGTKEGTAKRWITNSTDCGLLINRDGVYQLNNINHA